MGVLTARLHGPLTAMAALATTSLWGDLPNKPYMRSFFNATGQTILLSASYAPTASSSFDIDITLPSSGISSTLDSGRPSEARPTPPPHLTGSNGAMHTSASFNSLSGPIMFYRAQDGPPSKHLSIGQTYSSSQLRFPILRSGCIDPMLQNNQIERVNSFKWDASWMYFNIPQFYHQKQSCILSTFASSTLEATMPKWQPSYIDFKMTHMGDQKNQLLRNKPTVVVVLLGWLGAEQKHLKKYAEWYTARGIHAVTFVVPMKDLLTVKAGDKAEKHVDVLTAHLTQWLEDSEIPNEKCVIFHTFSNTGWLIYGAVLEKLINQRDKSLEKIKGCVVDSAPSATPDPQVWASGFSAALLKKSSVATQRLHLTTNKMVENPKPSLKETALLTMLEKFFSVFLQLPYVSERLSNVVSVLSNQQPSCPQLYIYSTADTVIPARSVEDFLEEQRKAGQMVSACNFQLSPHVDHFRTFPEKYSEQLTEFLALCVPQLVSK